MRAKKLHLVEKHAILHSIPDAWYTLFSATDLTDREERLEALHHLIGRLPELNHAVFERLIFHLARWGEREREGGREGGREKQKRARERREKKG